MPLKNLSIAMILGVAAMTLELFGYMQLCIYMGEYSPLYYWIMYASALVMFIFLPLHHIICCLCEWFYVRMGLTREALASVWDFFKCTVYTMYIGYLAMIVFAVAFLSGIATRQTALPGWAALFTLLPVAVVVLPTKLPAKANVIGAVMFLAMDSLKFAGREEEYNKFASTEIMLYRITSSTATLCAGFALWLGYRRA